MTQTHLSHHTLHMVCIVIHAYPTTNAHPYTLNSHMHSHTHTHTQITHTYTHTHTHTTCCGTSLGPEPVFPLVAPSAGVMLCACPVPAPSASSDELAAVGSDTAPLPVSPSQPSFLSTSPTCLWCVCVLGLIIYSTLPKLWYWLQWGVCSLVIATQSVDAMVRDITKTFQKCFCNN